MKYSGRQATREGAVGKGACWGTLGSYCILSRRTNMEFNTKRYHIVKPYFLTKSRIERHWQIIINLQMFDDIQNARKIMSKLHGKLTVRIFRICHSVLHGE